MIFGQIQRRHRGLHIADAAEIKWKKNRKNKNKNSTAGLGELFLNNPNYGCLQGGSSHIRGNRRFYSERERAGGRERGGGRQGGREREADLCSTVGPITWKWCSLNDAPVLSSMGALRSSTCQLATSYTGAPVLGDKLGWLDHMGLTGSKEFWGLWKNIGPPFWKWKNISFKVLQEPKNITRTSTHNWFEVPYIVRQKPYNNTK